MALHLRDFLNVFLSLLLSYFAFFPQASANVDYEGYSGPRLSEDVVDYYINQWANDPDWLPQNMDKVGQLRLDQFKGLVEKMDHTHYTFLHPARIKGSELGQLLNMDVKRLSLWAVRGGQLKPIPFQFDEYDSKLGWIYVPGKSPATVKGSYGLLDADDELIFMYRDAGQEQYNADTMKQVEGKVLQELKFTPKYGPVRYVYVLLDNPKRSITDYASIDLGEKETTITTSFYTVQSDPKSFIEFRNFAAHIGPLQGKTIVDNIRINASAGIIAKWARGHLDNDNIRINLIGAHDGAVRVASLAKLEILFAGVQIFSLYTQVNFYDQGIHIPNRTELGAASYFANVLRDPSIAIALDFVDVTGADVSAASVWENHGAFKVDGVMTEAEVVSNNLPLPGDWVWMDSKQGWSIFMKISMPAEMTEGLSTAIIYEDDPNSFTEWETFPGANPRIGIRTQGLPDAIDIFHELELDIGIWFADTVGDAGPAVFNEEVSTPLKMELKELTLVDSKLVSL